MTAFGSSPGFVPADGDPAWQVVSGDAVRARVAGGLVQLQFSTANGDGTHDIATVVLTGDLRDVRRNSLTQWPSYNSQGLPTNFVTDSDRRDGELLAARSHATVAGGPDDAPISASTPKVG